MPNHGARAQQFDLVANDLQRFAQLHPIELGARRPVAVGWLRTDTQHRLIRSVRRRPGLMAPRQHRHHSLYLAARAECDWADGHGRKSELVRITAGVRHARDVDIRNDAGPLEAR